MRGAPVMAQCTFTQICSYQNDIRTNLKKSKNDAKNDPKTIEKSIALKH